MTSLSRTLSARIAQRYGVVTRNDLVEDGLAADEVRGLVRSETIRRVHSGVYRIATSPDLFEARCVAACSADDEAAITGLGAARLWQFRHTPRVEMPQVMVRHDRTPLLPCR